MLDRSHMMNRSYGLWPPPIPPGNDGQTKFQHSHRPNFASTKPGWFNWKAKKSDKRKEARRKDPLVAGGGNESQPQNRLKARRFYNPRRRFNNRFAPFAPRNTTSFLIRAKKSGGIAALVSPCPVTPAILPTPMFSPSREVLVDMAKEEWGVDGYGSMKGLIRLRSPNHEEDEEENLGYSSDSEVERRLDHDLSRFEMIYPNAAVGGGIYDHSNLVLDDQDMHVAQLEEENLTLKERIFLVGRELEDLRKRVQCLDGRVDEGSENEGGAVCSEKSVADDDGDQIDCN